jgi:antitoxin component YwqK of YwqJK toxin-antitoxin module
MPAKKSSSKVHRVYHKDGSIWAKGKMLAGKYEGYWEWYRKDGVIMRSGHFEKGKQIGEWITYDKHGKIYKVTNLTKKK